MVLGLEVGIFWEYVLLPTNWGQRPGGPPTETARAFFYSAHCLICVLYFTCQYPANLVFVPEVCFRETKQKGLRAFVGSPTARPLAGTQGASAAPGHLICPRPCPQLVRGALYVCMTVFAVVRISPGDLTVEFVLGITLESVLMAMLVPIFLAVNTDGNTRFKGLVEGTPSAVPAGCLVSGTFQPALLSNAASIFCPHRAFHRKADCRRRTKRSCTLHFLLSLPRPSQTPRDRHAPGAEGARGAG